MRTVDVSGKDHLPAWPDLQLGRGEREGSRSESYTVVLRDASGKTFPHKPLNEEEWRGFEVGSTYKAILSPQGELVKLGELVSKAPPPASGMGTDLAPEGGTDAPRSED